MANTGKQRSLTCTINKLIAGVQQEGYPKTYQGRNEFTYDSYTYPAIDPLLMSLMPISQFELRLSAFKSYVESQEAGLNFGTDTVPGAEPYRENLDACPLV